MGIVFLFIIGLCAGSFINALTWRLHEGRDFVKARSQCPKCAHKLAPFDLLPLVSWAYLRGKCRYCRQNISKQYPAVELLAASWFASSYYFWPQSLDSGAQLVLFVSWLATSVGLIALLVYDRNWMILPSKIIYSSLFIALSGRLAYILFYSGDITSDFELWALSLLVASGIFFILHEVSKGQWIGFGDVRLGLVTGTLLATPAKSLLMIFIASALGVLFALPKALAQKKILNTRFAYGPFLIIATWYVMLFGSSTIDWYKKFFS